MKPKDKIPRRIAANRANAQKSTGPKTPEGKARSSLNSFRHGLAASTFVVHNEDLADYTQLRDAYIDRFGPRDQVELDSLERMVHATWNQRRTWSMQNEMLNVQMLRMEPQLAKEYIELPESARLALAVEELAKQSGMPLFHRYDAHASLEFQRGFKTLQDLRKFVPLASPGAAIQSTPAHLAYPSQYAEPKQDATPQALNTERTHSHFRTPPAPSRAPPASYTEEEPHPPPPALAESRATRQDGLP